MISYELNFFCNEVDDECVRCAQVEEENFDKAKRDLATGL